MGHNDSVDKIVYTYFASVNAVPFEYKGKTFPVPNLKVSPLLFRSATCPSNCGGCCGPYSLDYIPTETPPDGYAEERTISFDGREVPIRTISQPAELTAPDNKCRFLDRSNGRCGIHSYHGFSCDFELIRFVRQETPIPNVRLTSQLYGRKWAMKRVDGGKGGLCEMIPANIETIKDARRKLSRLKEWTDYFGLETRLPQIIEWIDRNTEQPEKAQTLHFPADPAIAPYETPYYYVPETLPQPLTELGMPDFPKETTWWEADAASSVTTATL